MYSSSLSTLTIRSDATRSSLIIFAQYIIERFPSLSVSSFMNKSVVSILTKNCLFPPYPFCKNIFILFLNTSTSSSTTYPPTTLSRRFNLFTSLKSSSPRLRTSNTLPLSLCSYFFNIFLPHLCSAKVTPLLLRRLKYSTV